MGMDVYGYDPYVSVEHAWHLSRKITHVLNVEDIYRECDYITIHVPLMGQTKKMINAEAIDMMKDGVVIINMARDALVDEEAMLKALDAGKVHRYVSDFPNTTVAGHPNCITTPHLGASTAESEDNCAMMAVDELQEYIENGNIRNSVNYPSCDMGICASESRIGIFHKNQKNMIGGFTQILGDAGVNISEMANKSRGEVAYTLLDLDSKVDETTLEKLRVLNGVFRVRVVK